jgi:phosphoglycerate dehydrogenase-like enzyme
MKCRVLFQVREGYEGDFDYLRSLVPGVTIVTAKPGEEPYGDFEVIIGAWFEGELLDRYPALAYAVVPFAGVPVQDRELVLARPKLTLVNSHFNAPYAAEHAWGLLLAVVKRIVQADREMRRGNWAIRYTDAGITVLRGSTCGIVGYGAVGRELARLARAFEMRVLAIRRTPDEATGGPGDLLRLLEQSDAIFLSVPLTCETKGMIGARELARMKPGTVLINIARGEIVDEEALFTSLKERRICAALDTWYSYPRTQEAQAHHFPSKLPFHELDSVVMSPHRSAAVLEGDQARMEDLGRILREIQAGRRPPNIVDPLRGY